MFKFFFFLNYICPQADTDRYMEMCLPVKICIYKCVADGSLGPVYIPISVTTSILKTNLNKIYYYYYYYYKYIYIKDCGLYTNYCKHLCKSVLI